jgi:tight adherence protein B
MTTTMVFVMLFVGAGAALVIVGLLLRVRDREEALAEILDLPYGEHDVPVEAISETQSSLVTNTVGLAAKMVDQFDSKGAMSSTLERARILMRPGEYVVVTAASGVILASILVAVTGQWLFALAGLAAAALIAVGIPRRRIAKRRKAFEAQLPDAMTLIASSLSAGHTFLRAIQMMCEEAEAPLSEEFARVVSETRLGDPVVDAIERMAFRLQIRDLEWVVQAIRIQQTVGGKLADLLHTLADFIRAREEVRREILVLTAEGRISAWVLAALPVFLFFTIQVISPGYMQPLYQGWGLFVLGGTIAMVVAGVGIIFRMVRIEV